MMRVLKGVFGGVVGLAVLPPVILFTAQDQPRLTTGAVRFLGSTILPLAIGAHVDVDEMRGTLGRASVKGFSLHWASDGWLAKRKFDGVLEIDDLQWRLSDADWAAFRSSPVQFVKSVLAFEPGEPQRQLDLSEFRALDVFAVVRFREPSPTPPPNVRVGQLELARVHIQPADWTRRKSAEPIALPDVWLHDVRVRDVASRRPLSAVLFRSAVVADVGDGGRVVIESDATHARVRLTQLPVQFVKAYVPALRELDEASVQMNVRFERRGDAGWRATGEFGLSSLKINSSEPWKVALLQQLAPLAQKPLAVDLELGADVDAELVADRFVLKLGLAIAAETVNRNKDAIVEGAQKAWQAWQDLKR